MLVAEKPCIKARPAGMLRPLPFLLFLEAFPVRPPRLESASSPESLSGGGALGATIAFFARRRSRLSSKPVAHMGQNASQRGVNAARTITVLVVRARIPASPLARLCFPALVLLRALSSLSFIVCGFRELLWGLLGRADDIGVYCALLGSTLPFGGNLVWLGVIAMRNPVWSYRNPL